MKTYILDLPNRLNRISENLDVKSVLCNKSWVVFNETGDKELYIFQENGELIISLNGVVTSAAWQYISANKTILIKGKDQSYMLHPSFYDNVLFVLSLDGKKESCMFLIDENNKDSFIPKSLGDIQSHLLGDGEKETTHAPKIVHKEEIPPGYYIESEGHDNKNILFIIGALIVASCILAVGWTYLYFKFYIGSFIMNMCTDAFGELYFIPLPIRNLLIFGGFIGVWILGCLLFSYVLFFVILPKIT